MVLRAQAQNKYIKVESHNVGPHQVVVQRPKKKLNKKNSYNNTGRQNANNQTKEKLPPPQAFNDYYPPNAPPTTVQPNAPIYRP